jgi:hypothetical protein
MDLGVKSGLGVTPTTHPHVQPRSRMSRSYTSSPAWRQQDSFTLLCIFYEVRTEFLKKIKAFLEIVPYSLVEADRRFRGSYCLDQGDDRSDDGDYTVLYPRKLSSSYSLP